MSKSNNKTALVTSGAKRIGREICLRLAELGYDIVLTYLSSGEEAFELQNKINSIGRKCILKQCDLTLTEKIPGLMDEVIAECPNLELIVNNASIFERSIFSDTSLEELDKNLSIHLRTPFVIVREFSRRVAEGQVINMLDTRITKNKTAYFAYLISKKALADFTLMAASSLGPNIRVNGIAPGLILPPEGEGDEYLTQFAQKIPAKKQGSIDNITDSLEFLVKNDYITGQIIFNDGGEHLI